MVSIKPQDLTSMPPLSDLIRMNGLAWLDITQLVGYSSVMTYTVETATETRTFTNEQDAKDWQATQPAGSSRY